MFLTGAGKAQLSACWSKYEMIYDWRKRSNRYTIKEKTEEGGNRAEAREWGKRRKLNYGIHKKKEEFFEYK